MLPIRDRNPSQTFPYMTYSLVAANVVIFLFELTLQYSGQLDAFLMNWSMIPERVMAGKATITILTSMFLHGGIMHIFGNMLYLGIFGNNVEDIFGHLKFLFFYFFRLFSLFCFSNHFCFSEPATYPRYLDSNVVSGFGVWDKGYEAFNSCYAFASAACLFNVHVVFFSHLHRFRRESSDEPPSSFSPSFSSSSSFILHLFTSSFFMKILFTGLT